MQTSFVLATLGVLTHDMYIPSFETQSFAKTIARLYPARLTVSLACDLGLDS